MGEKDNGPKRFAVFFLFGDRVENGERVLDVGELATDPKTAEEGIIALADRLGADSWSTRTVEEDGSLGERKFHFSGTVWKAPWQPEGPKPNWKKAASETPQEPGRMN